MDVAFLGIRPWIGGEPIAKSSPYSPRQQAQDASPCVKEPLPGQLSPVHAGSFDTLNTYTAGLQRQFGTRIHEPLNDQIDEGDESPRARVESQVLIASHRPYEVELPRRL